MALLQKQSNCPTNSIENLLHSKHFRQYWSFHIARTIIDSHCSMSVFRFWIAKTGNEPFLLSSNHFACNRLGRVNKSFAVFFERIPMQVNTIEYFLSVNGPTQWVMECATHFLCSRTQKTVYAPKLSKIVWDGNVENQ